MTSLEDRAHREIFLESITMLRPFPPTGIFRALSGSNSDYATAYSIPMESSPARISADDFELLQSSAMFESFDHDMIISGLESSTIMHREEVTASLGNSEKWDPASDHVFSTWNSDSNPVGLKDVDLSNSETCSGATIHPILKVNTENSGKLQESIGTVSTGCANVLSTPEKRKGCQVRNVALEVKRSRSMNKVFKPSDSSENSEALEDDEVDKHGEDGKNSASKNLVSERRRRRKLNERLYSLRALVPRISKMDKASIVSDAISYVQELQKQVEQIQADIIALESSKVSTNQGPCHESNKDIAANIVRRKPLREHRILELDVSQMEEHTYHLRIHCKKGPGVLVQLTKALEALDLEIVNASLTSVHDNIINTIVVKAKLGELLTAEELKRLTLNVLPKFGLIYG